MPHKLLLADDSVTIQRVIELTFADEDVQVLVAGNGRQAIERMQAERPDIVLADVGMPERDGYEVAAFIKGNPQLASIPVILLTGAFEPLDEGRARSVGCDGVLVKPFEPQLVINRVRELLERRAPATPPAARTDAAPAAAPAPPGVAAPAADGETGHGAIPARPAGLGDRSLEEYFDRLDAAFANAGAPARRAAPVEPDPAFARLGEIEKPPPALAEPPLPPPGPSGRAPEHAGHAPEPPVETPPSPWDSRPIEADAAPARQPHLASAFAALLAEEQGEPAPPDPGPAPASPAPVTDQVVDEIAQRVIARMGDESMRRLVLDTAERLVREEIERIKKMSGSPDPQSGA